MKEAHYFYTLNDFMRSLSKSGFSVKYKRKYKFEREVWKQKLQIVNVDFENPISYILIMAEKRPGLYKNHSSFR